MYLAQVTRWMIQQPKKATCPGMTIATNMEITNINRAEFLFIPAQYYFFLIRGKRQDWKRLYNLIYPLDDVP